MEKNMLDYIKETPEVLLNIIDNSREYTKDLVEAYLKNRNDGLYIIASGSSYNGSLIAVPFIKHILNLEVKLQTPFTFENHEIEYLRNEMLMAVSQSGCSTNTLSVLKSLKEKGRYTACLVGRDDCDAKDIADLTINWKVGEEKIGFVTKGVSSLACFLMCFAAELALALGKIDLKRYEHIKDVLRKTQSIQPEIVEKTVSLFEKNKDELLDPRRVVLLSSGPSFGIITEGALKIAETSCLSAFAYEAEEFLHGPLYPSRPDDLILVCDNGDSSSSSRIVDIALALKDITKKVFILSNDSRLNDDHVLKTSDSTCQYSSVLYKLSFFQTLAYLMTEATNRYEPHEAVKAFKKANKVASKSRENLYLDLQKVN